MKKICWITPDYFLIVDAPKVPHLVQDFHIEWLLFTTHDTGRKPDGLIHEFKPEEYKLKFRQRDPRIILQYIGILRKIKRSNPDLIYISFHGFPYFFPLFFMFFDPDKVIWGVHNIINPRGSYKDRMMDIYQSFIFKRIRNVQVFSAYQLGIVRRLFPGKNHYCIPLTLEDYGVSRKTPPQNTIRFMFFGYLEKYKGVELLIRSFSELQNKGYNVELVIAGSSGEWINYYSLASSNEKITMIKGPFANSDIPDIISSCHYIVLPYIEATQSGVLRLAYQYNKPVIVSDIETFRQSVVENVSGYFFHTGSQSSLTETLIKVARDHPSNYEELKKKLIDYVKREYDFDKVVEQYKLMLSECTR